MLAPGPGADPAPPCIVLRRLLTVTMPAMKRSCSTVLLVLGIACIGRPAGAPVAPPGQPARVAIDTTRFEEEIRGFEAADRTSMPAAGGILFVGSSSMRLWPGLASDFPGRAIINRGFGGSTLAEVTHYAPRIVIPYRPRLVVVYAGDNDLATGMTPAEVAADYRRLVAVVRRALPGARIAFVSIKPSPSRWHLVEAYRAANRLISAEIAGDTAQAFVDVFTPMIGANGRPRPELFVSDSLHMTRAGYDLWRERLRPVVEQGH